MVQLRVKQLGDADALDLANQLLGLCRRYQVPFLVNDRLDVALAVGADGVHLGLQDLPVSVARRLRADGPGSTHDCDVHGPWTEHHRGM